jgi:hypothetical protein
MTPASIEKNEAILARVEALGGGYVWDAELFSVMLMNSPLSDAEARILAGLVGVQHLALDGSRASVDTLRAIASIPGLQSLVLGSPLLSQAELQSLRTIGPAVEVVHE